MDYIAGAEKTSRTADHNGPNTDSVEKSGGSLWKFPFVLSSVEAFLGFLGETIFGFDPA